MLEIFYTSELVIWVVFCWKRGDHGSSGGKHYWVWKFSCDYWALASTLHLDLLLCGKVCFHFPYPYAHLYIALNIYYNQVLFCSYALCFSLSPLPFVPFVHKMYFRTKRLGLILKILSLLLLPVPLVLWPIVGIVCSFLGGIAYGFFAPLLATFEAVGESVTDKFFHCFVVSHSTLTTFVLTFFLSYVLFDTLK